MIYNKLFINGNWTDGHSGDVIDVLNPWSLDVIACVPRGDATDVDRAVQAARAAFDRWAATPLDERIAIIENTFELFKDKRDLLLELEIDELGQPRAWTADVHIDWNFDLIAAFIDVAKHYSYHTPLTHGTIVREPIGVVGCLTPWNYPLGQVVQKVFPAILAGNTTVLKPSQHTPLTAYHLVKSFQEAGLPKGVLNLVTGRGGEVGDHLCLHKDIDMISFTGSTASGRSVGRQALSTIKKIALELGGKSPCLCLPGCDYDAAAQGAATSVFANSGQTCDATTRFIVPKSDHHQAITALEKAAAAWHAGNPRDDASDFGPIINAKQYAKVRDYIASGVTSGATLICGEIPPEKPAHHLIQPTVFTDVTADMRIVREEIFGPVIVVQTYDTIEEGIAIANDTTYGLGAVVRGPQEAALAAASRIRSGQVYVNDGQNDAYAPFGGYKQSGLGREAGVHGYEEYLEIKTIFS